MALNLSGYFRNEKSGFGITIPRPAEFQQPGNKLEYNSPHVTWEVHSYRRSAESLGSLRFDDGTGNDNATNQ